MIEEGEGGGGGGEREKKGGGFSDDLMSESEVEMEANENRQS